MIKSVVSVAAAAAIGFGGAYVALFPDHGQSIFHAASASVGDCNIKGNVSISRGERIYHVPGQKYYDDTRISASHGERWFCSEREARAAGWRRSKV